MHGITETATLLDDVKAMGYKYSTIGAITVGVSDMEIPKEKKQYLLEAEERKSIRLLRTLGADFLPMTRDIRR